MSGEFKIKTIVYKSEFFNSTSAVSIHSETISFNTAQMANIAYEKLADRKNESRSYYLEAIKLY